MASRTGRTRKPRPEKSEEDVPQPQSEYQGTQESPKPAKPKSDHSSSYLRAARAGKLEKLLDLLDSGRANLTTANAIGLGAIHLAAKEGHIDIVSELLRRGVDINTTTNKGNTPLHISSLAGQLDVIKLLVQNDALINAQSETGFTPLYMAAQENHVSVVKYLLDRSADPALATEDGFTPLAIALQQGHTEVVNLLMEQSQKGRVRLSALHIAAKKDDLRSAILLLQNNENTNDQPSSVVNETTKSDFTPLHIAAHYGNVSVAKLLIEKGANVNFKAKNGISPLHVSSKWGRTNIVSLLLDNNANIDCRTRDGLTPLHCAARSGHDAVVDLLLERGAPVSAKTRNGLTALHMAAQGDHYDTARILIYRKALVDDVTVDYLTPLHVAAHCGSVVVAKLLLDCKCQVNACALNGFTALHIACKKNRIKVIELLLQYGAHLSSMTESGLTPLHVASFMGHLDVVSYLLQRGCDPNATTMRGETSLHLAARGSQTDVIKLLLRSGAEVDARAKEQQTALHIAARLGAVDCMLLLLENGANPDAATIEQYTALHIAAKEGHEDVVQLLLDRGADSGLVTSKGFTALHISAKYGTVRVARVMIKKGADVNVAGKNGLTPLHVASHYNHPSMVTLLLTSKASPHSIAKNGYTPLHIAAKKDEVDVATALMEYGAKPNAESKNGFTPLHLASQEGHTDVVTLLLDRRANSNSRAKNGLTPMHLAAQEDHVPVAEILVKYKAQIDPQTKAGYTPLHTACHFGQLNMVRFLLEHGASVSAVTKLGHTPLHQAAQQGHVLIIKLLLRYHSNPDALTTTGQSALSIAEQLGYISVVEILRQVTQVIVTTSADKYKLHAPEVMLEPAMSDDEDDDTQLAEHSYQYLTTGEDLKGLQEESPTRHKDRDGDLFAFEQSGRRSTTSSVGGHGQIQEELRYTTEPDEAAIESPALRDLQYATLMTQEQHQPQHQQQSPPVDTSVPVWDSAGRQPDNVEIERQQLIRQTEYERREKPGRLDINKPTAVNGVDIVVTTDDARLSPFMVTETLATPTDGAARRSHKSSVSETDSRMFGGSSSAMSYASSFDPDNIALRHPVYSGFLVSFLVDARGGAMRGCRHSGIRIIIPPLRLCQPTRITCKLVRLSKLPQAPPLMEGEALASRVLVMGPSGVKFMGPVILEMPHFASLRGGEREITVLRSDNGQTWREHPEVATEQSVQNLLRASFEDLEAAEELYQRRITRIVASDFPKYFAVVTRVRHDTALLGPDGGLMSSRANPQVQAVFPPTALTKPIKVGLQAQSLPSDLVTKVLGSGVYVGPIVTIEPRRRKFHKPITVTLPLPWELQSLPKYNVNNLRLLCSIAGGSDSTEWEDITGSTQMSIVNHCITFTSAVSARFWLIYCTTPSDAVSMATKLYAEAIVVPFMANFVVFAKRRSENEAQLRVFCMTDDKMDKTLECQERFRQVARSRDVEVLNGKRQYIDISGNLVTVIKSDADTYKPPVIIPDAAGADGNEPEKLLYVSFRAFRENRRHVNVRVWDVTREPVGTAVFLVESPKLQRNQTPVCMLNVNLADVEEGRYVDMVTPAADTTELCRKLAALPNAGDEDQISKAQLRLTDIAEHLESDWVMLADQLGIAPEEVAQIQRDYQYVVEQALVMLHKWVEKNGDAATGNVLERALTNISREDIIHKCMHSVEQITDDSEKQAARAQLDELTDDERRGKPLTEAELMSSVQQCDNADVSFDSLQQSVSTVSTAPLRQTFEDWALQTTPSPTHLPGGPTAGTTTYMETAFEDWVEQHQLDYNQQPAEHSRLELDGGAAVENGNYAVEGEDDIRWETVEGDAELRVELNDSKETLDDGTTVHRQTVTRHRVCPISDVLIVNDVVTEHRRATDRLLDVSIEEDVLVLPPGVEDPDLSDDLKTVTDVQEVEESLDDGTPVYRRITTTTVVPAVHDIPPCELPEPASQFASIEFEPSEEEIQFKHSEPPPTDLTHEPTESALGVESADRFSEPAETVTDVDQSAPLSDVADAEMEIERRAEQVVAQSMEAALQELHSTSPADGVPAELYDDDDTAMLRVYTDTLEGEPQTETDVQETEETLPDGTVVRRRITTTRQQQTIVKRVVMEGPEDELPTNEDEAEQLLQQTNLADEDEVLRHYGDVTETDPDAAATNVEESEETLADGTVVKRRVVTTTQQQLTTEKVVLETDDDWTSSRVTDDDDNQRPVFEYTDNAAEANQNGADDDDDDDDADREGDDDDDEEDETTRVVLKKEIRRQRVLRDGKEETVITEDIHVVQEDETSPELDAAMHHIVDQFAGRTHSGESSV